MTLEAIAALLGHRSLDMTLRYAKIANRTVADEYFAVTEKVESLYQQGKSLPADTIGPRMARLRREHHRLLGNGYCTRPAQQDCAFESICENCAFFQTSIEFRPTLQRQHDHAAANNQTHRADLFNRLLDGLDVLVLAPPLDADRPAGEGARATSLREVLTPRVQAWASRKHVAHVDVFAMAFLECLSKFPFPFLKISD